MDSFTILLFALIIVVYFIPCTPITISENFRGGGHGGGFGGHGGGFGGHGHYGNMGSITSGNLGHGYVGHNNIGGRPYNGQVSPGYERKYGPYSGYGGYGGYGGYWGNPGWWGPIWGGVLVDGGDYVIEDDGGDNGNIQVADNSNYTNNYYNNDFDSDYISPLQQKLLTSSKEEQQ